MDIYEKARNTKAWHHNIEKIDGRWVEDVVTEFRLEQDNSAKEKMLDLIIENYAIFRMIWAKSFALLMDGDLEAGKVLHDEIVWRCARKFDYTKCLKPKGKAFNAFLVSAQMNSLKNLRTTKMSHKNHPRVNCPLCDEDVYQIDEKHLKHEIDLHRYQKMFRKYPIVSTDGLVAPPWGGEAVPEITEGLLNRSRAYINSVDASPEKPLGYYTIKDLLKEFPQLAYKREAICPLTKMRVRNVNSKYPSSLMNGYTESEFIKDFPSFEAIVCCPFTGEKRLEVSQEYMDSLFKQSDSNKRITIASFMKKYENFTTKPKQVPVLNPYTGKMVKEITHEMLAAAGTNVKDHLARYTTIVMDKRYEDYVRCPFTGKRTFKMTKEHLDKIGRTVHEFYQAACKYPLRKWQVKVAITGEWVDNVWEYLAEKAPKYASSMSMEEFESTHGKGTRAFVSTNSYVENDSGESMHISDILVQKKETGGVMEIEDSLMKVAADDLDKKIVTAIKGAHTIEDVFFSSASLSSLTLSAPFKLGTTKDMRAEVKGKLGHLDFDISSAPKEGCQSVTIMVPSRDTIKKRLARMISASDLSN